MGTWQFMSAYLIQNQNAPPVIEDDLESSLYVVLWAALKYSRTHMTNAQRTLLFKEIFETEEVEKTRSSTKKHFLIGRTDLAHSPVFIDCKPLDDLIVALAELFLHWYSVVSPTSWKAYELYQWKDVESLSPDTQLLVKLNPAYTKMEDGWPSEDKAIEQVLLNKKNLPLQIYMKSETQMSSRAAPTPTGKRCRLNSSSDDLPTDTLIPEEDPLFGSAHPNAVPAIEAGGRRVCFTGLPFSMDWTRTQG
ncbi:hypothetical protein BDR05DRAFT_953344 [Suillus weaverae]|nr:hypothetical protein BDR05DRAFT_953344 [Suillus weaverae]